jgi:hypothetical protein
VPVMCSPKNKMQMKPLMTICVDLDTAVADA